MALNPGIFNAFVQPLRSVGDYEQQYMARDAEKQRNAFASAQMQMQMQGLERTKAVRNLLMQHGATEQAVPELMKIGAFDEATHVQKALQEQRAMADAAKLKAARESYISSLTPGSGQPVAFNPIDAYARTQDQALVKFLSEAQNLGRPEVSRVIEGRGADGRPVQTQFDKYGNPVGQPIQKAYELKIEDLGGKRMAVDPYAVTAGQSFQKTQTPDSIASVAATMRGQNMADARSREKNRIDAAAAGKVEWKQDTAGNWVGLPKDVRTSGPVTPVTVAMPGKREMSANSALDIIKEVRGLIPLATGSGLGKMADSSAAFFGKSTSGAQAAARLQAAEGALMMVQPRMEGPQSNMDVALYRQMAGQIGDPNVPAETKAAAIKQVEALHKKYATKQPQTPGVIEFGSMK